MGRLKKILIFSSIFFLASCGNGDNDNGEIEVDSQEPTEQSENVESEEVDWKDATGDIDFSEDDLDEIAWEDIHLSKAQFKDFLDEMAETPFEVDEDSEDEFELEVFDVNFDGEIIEYTITSVDEDDFMKEFSRVMYVYMLDGFTRQFYLQSDYSNGENHPIVIFYDEDGSVITENDDFIEMDIDEE